MGDLDIAIAGCGIAGLAAALLLHRAGHNVALYERFEQPRPLGSGLMIQPTGLAVLAELGLAEQVVARGARVGRLFGKNAEGSVVLDARYTDFAADEVFGLGIHRASLFDALYRAVEAAGIPVCTGCEVIGSEVRGGGRRLLFRDREPSPAHDLVIDALGVASTLSRLAGGWLPYGALWTSLQWPAGGPFRPDWLEQRYERAHRMAGVLPTGRREPAGPGELAFFWSLRADEFSDWRQRGLARWKGEVRALWPECDVLLEQVADPEALTFARYAHRTTRSVAGERLIHIGDSWHSASPQLGQGANMALLDAFALAQALSCDEPLERRLQRAISLRRFHVGLYQRLTALFTPLYQSNAVLPAVLRDAVLAPLGRIGPGPRIQAMLVGGLAGKPLERLGLRMPAYAAFTS